MSGDPGQSHRGVEHWRLSGEWKGRNRRIRQNDVLTGPHRFEARSLGRPRDPDCGSRIPTGPKVDGEQAYLHEPIDVIRANSMRVSIRPALIEFREIFRDRENTRLAIEVDSVS